RRADVARRFLAHRDLESGKSRTLAQRQRRCERRILSVSGWLNRRGRCRRDLRDSTGRFSARPGSDRRCRRTQNGDDLYWRSPLPALSAADGSFKLQISTKSQSLKSQTNARGFFWGLVLGIWNFLSA